MKITLAQAVRIGVLSTTTWLATVSSVSAIADETATAGETVIANEIGSQVALQSVVSRALEYLNVPYRLGGTDPKSGFDCSGLVVHVFRSTLGLSLPRTARQLASVGESVDRTVLQPGDLVFFNTRGTPFSHVGIYIGDSKFIHAPRPRSRVRLDSLDDPAYARSYQGARRIS